MNRDAILGLVNKYGPKAVIVSTVRSSGDGPELRNGPEPRANASQDHSPAPRGSADALQGQHANGPKDSPVPREGVSQPDSPAIPPAPPPELNFLQQQGLPVLVAGVHLKLPITLLYKTPETLGSDRLASALAATVFFPKENTLVINAGTCLTTDFVTEKGEYIGGSIAPGLRMRLKAMHHFTGRLPLIEFSEGAAGFNKAITELPGQTTENSMLAGVTTGMVAEIDGLIEIWRKKISFFNVILSGGDAIFFDKKLKNRIFAVDNIVLHGLNLMLKHNVQHL